MVSLSVIPRASAFSRFRRLSAVTLKKFLLQIVTKGNWNEKMVLALVCQNISASFRYFMEQLLSKVIKIDPRLDSSR